MSCRSISFRFFSVRGGEWHDDQRTSFLRTSSQKRGFSWQETIVNFQHDRQFPKKVFLTLARSCVFF